MNHREPFRRSPSSAAKREIARIRQAYGGVNRERGRINEHRVLEAVERLCEQRFPAFLRSDPRPRLATREEDSQGIDVVAHSDVGPLYLQVKSSHWGRKRFLGAAHKHAITVVLVERGSSDAEVESRTRTALRRVHEQVSGGLR